MKTIDLIQGSPEWHAHRARHFNASDAPAMMGCSPYMTRTELLTRMKTGVAPEVDAGTQRVFDAGHRFETLARPLAEAIIGEDLYAVTGTNGKLSASFDGLTLLGDTAFEHKTLNARLRAAFDKIQDAVARNVLVDAVDPSYCAAQLLPVEYLVQLEQQCHVSGCEKILFMASSWNDDGTLIEERHCWYTPNPEHRAHILAGWEQFERDLADFVPAAIETPKPTGRAPESLPALRIEVTGAVTASNLTEFKAQAMAVFRGISRDLQTDADFADAEATVKWAKGIEDRLATAKESALAQTESIDTLFRTIDDIAAEARRVRLDLDKLVKARKEELRVDTLNKAARALSEHCTGLRERVGIQIVVPADFAGAIKGKRSLSSMQDAVDTELARAKIAANELADRMQANIKTLATGSDDWAFLFPDIAAVAGKASDDFAALLAQRVAKYKQDQEDARNRALRMEAERQQREAEAAEQAAAAVELAAAKASDGAPLSPAAQTLYEKEGAERFARHHPAVAAMPANADDGARMKLGQINACLSPIQINQAGLSQLGFDPVGKDKSAVLYRESDFPAICQAIAKHAMGAVATA